VESLAKGYQDPHFVEPKPSFLLKLRQADVLITVGLQLEIGWLPPLITKAATRASRSARAAILTLRSLPRFSTFRRARHPRHGRRSPARNPHYCSIPTMAGGLPRLCAEVWRTRSPDVAYFQQRFQDFDKRLSAPSRSGKQKWRPTKGGSWSLITTRSPISQALSFERDWIHRAASRHSADPSHTIELIGLMKRENCKLAIVEPYFDLKTPTASARRPERKSWFICRRWPERNR